MVHLLYLCMYVYTHTHRHMVAKGVRKHGSLTLSMLPATLSANWSSSLGTTSVLVNTDTIFEIVVGTSERRQPANILQ